MKQFLKSRFILLLVAILFSTCYDDERYFYGEESRRDMKKEVSSARQWYEANVDELSIKADGSRGLQLSVVPCWEDAVVNSNARTTRVEIPVTGPGKFHFLNKESRSRYESGDKRYATSLTRLVIQTNRRTGQQIGFLMTISPSVECLEKTDFNPFDKLWYMNVPKSYGGHIVYHDLSGKFVNGWEYRNGKIKHAIHRRPDNDNNADLITKSMSSGYNSCYTVEVDILLETCTDYYSEPNGNGVYQGTYCTYEWDIYLWEYCEDYDDGSGNDSGNSSEADNGGGGGGGYNPPAPPPGPLTPAIRTDCSNGTITNSNKIIAVMNDENSAYYDRTVKRYTDSLRRYARTESVEKVFVVNYYSANNMYLVLNQSNDSSVFYIRSGTANNVTYSTFPSSYMIVHTHPNGKNAAPSPSDAYALGKTYKDNTTKGDTSNITANVIIAADGSECGVCEQSHRIYIILL